MITYYLSIFHCLIYLPCLIDVGCIHLSFKEILDRLLIFVIHWGVGYKCHVLDYKKKTTVENQLSQGYFHIKLLICVILQHLARSPHTLKSFIFAIKSQPVKVIIFRKKRLKVSPEIMSRHLFLFSSWFFSSCISMRPSSLPISLVVWVLHITDFCDLALPTLECVDLRDLGNSSSVALIDLGTRSSSGGWVVSDEIESNKHYLNGSC